MKIQQDEGHSLDKIDRYNHKYGHNLKNVYIGYKDVCTSQERGTLTCHLQTEIM